MASHLSGHWEGLSRQLVEKRVKNLAWFRRGIACRVVSLFKVELWEEEEEEEEADGRRKVGKGSVTEKEKREGGEVSEERLKAKGGGGIFVLGFFIFFTVALLCYLCICIGLHAVSGLARRNKKRNGNIK